MEFKVMTSLAIIAVVSAVAVIPIYFKKLHTRPQAETPFEQDADAERLVNRCRDIIKYRNPDTGNTLKKAERLESRTRPNQRLNRAFGIDNAFTTDSSARAGSFITDAKKKLRNAIGLSGAKQHNDDLANWMPIIDSMRAAIKEEFMSATTTINVAQFVQVVTLRVSLKYLFDLEDKSLGAREALTFVAAKINDLWVRSKQYESTEWKDQKEMHSHLKAITSQDPLHHIQNPMNFILPAYETMWHAVFRGILEISFRPHEEARTWRQLLTQINNDPFRANWKSAVDRKQVCALDVVKEVLRLYPPTGHVHRYFQDQAEVAKADLQKCHRNKNLATEDPDKFDPARWAALRERCAKSLGRDINDLTDKEIKVFEEDVGFMPFALTCPAGGSVSYGFGFKMIALLVGMLSEHLDGLQGWILIAGKEEDELPDVGTALDNSREHYLNLVYGAPA